MNDATRSKLALIRKALVNFEQYFDDKSDGGVESTYYDEASHAIAQLDSIQISMTVHELIKLVMDRRPLSEIRADTVPVDLTCRFIAFTESEEVRDAFDMKDYIEMMLEGQPLGGPFKTEDDIQRWINRIVDAWIEEPEGESNAWAWIDGALNRFYGIPSINKEPKE